MELAREIAEALFPINANTRRYNFGLTRDREAQREAATPIIAAKLEPVREACGKITDCAARDRNEGCRFCSDASKCLDDLMDSLATLSEEE